MREKSESLRRISILTALGAIIIAIFGLLSYIPGLRVFGSLSDDYIPMAPSTALSFIILGLIILLFPFLKQDKRKILLANILMVIVSIFGLLEVIGFMLNKDLNFEDVLVPSSGTLNGIPIGRMSPSTGGVFFITGIALILLVSIPLLSNIKHIKNLPGTLGIFILFSSFIFVLAYAYDTPIQYNQGTTIPMALTTALGFLVLSLAIISSTDLESIPIKFLMEDNTQSQLLKTFLPISIIAVLLGSFGIATIKVTNINTAFLSALYIVIVATITSVAVSIVSKKVGKSIDLAESERDKKALELEYSIIELERSNKELEMFASVASHDLQEPLRTITGYLELLKEKNLDQIDKDAYLYINHSLNASKRLRDLITDLLIYSRIGTHKNNIKINDFNLILKSIINDLSNLISENNAKITFDIMPSLQTDKNQICQLFQNLLSNSLKFSGENSPVIHFGVEKKDNWEFYIKDNGIGIDEKYFDRIFLIFQRLHTRSEYPGTGIGLAICKKIVEQNNGKIWVESKFGEGSTFFFTLSTKNFNG